MQYMNSEINIIHKDKGTIQLYRKYNYIIFTSSNIYSFIRRLFHKLQLQSLTQTLTSSTTMKRIIATICFIALLNSQFISKSSHRFSSFYQNQSITLQDLRDPLEEIFGVATREAYDFMINAHNQLRAYTVVLANTLETRLGIIKVLYFQSSGDIIRTVTLMDSRNKISQIDYGTPQSLNDDPINIIKQLGMIIFLDNREVLQIQSKGQEYTIDFLGNNDSILRITVRKDSIDSGISYFSDNIQLGEAALPHIQKHLIERGQTEYVAERPSMINYENNQFFIANYRNASISVELDHNEFVVNELVREESGSYNYNADERFFDSYQHIKKISPIANLPPIREVKRINYERGILYQIIYELQNKVDVQLWFTVPLNDLSKERIIRITLNNQTIAQQLQNITKNLYDQTESLNSIIFKLPLQAVVGCSEYYEGTNRCRICQNRYYLSFNQNICLSVPDTCILHDPVSPICYSCIQGYSLIRGRCIQTVISPPVVPCIRVDGIGKCIQCSHPYYLVLQQNKCNKLPNDCLNATLEILNSEVEGLEIDRCTQCSPGYTLTTFGTCILRNILNCLFYENDSIKCIECRNRFFLYEPKNICVEVSAGCNQYNKQNGQCINCIEGYALNPANKDCYQLPASAQITKCEIRNQVPEVAPIGCIKCLSGYVLINGNCFQEIPRCATYDQNGDCTLCSQGAFLSNKSCVFFF